MKPSRRLMHFKERSRTSTDILVQYLCLFSTFNRNLNQIGTAVFLVEFSTSGSIVTSKRFWSNKLVKDRECAPVLLHSSLILPHFFFFFSRTQRTISTVPVTDDILELYHHWYCCNCRSYHHAVPCAL